MWHVGSTDVFSGRKCQTHRDTNAVNHSSYMDNLCRSLTLTALRQRWNRHGRLSAGIRGSAQHEHETVAFLGRRCFVPEAWFVHFNASPNVFVIFIWSMWKALWQMVVGWNCACVSRKHWIYLGLLHIPWFVHTAWVCGHVHHFLELHLCHRLAGVDGRARFRSFRLCLDRKKLSSIQPACGKHSDDVRAGLTGGGLDLRNPLEGWGWKVPWLVCATCRLQQQSRSNSRFFSSRASIQRCSVFQQRAYPLDESMVSTASSGLFSLEGAYMAK